MNCCFLEHCKLLFCYCLVSSSFFVFFPLFLTVAHAAAWNMMQALSLRDTSLAELHDSLSSVTNLHRLEIRNLPALESFPEFVPRFVNLVHLEIRSTSISCLPPAIGQLSSLTRLLLIGNKLTKIPNEIGNLKRLYELDLNHNLLEYASFVFAAAKYSCEQNNRITIIMRCNISRLRHAGYCREK